MQAYNDDQGTTAQFNLNLLKRINRELRGDFTIERFMHYATYEPVEETMKSYILSKEKQQVHIEYLNKSFSFDAWEALQTESSYKYCFASIDKLAAQSGFEVVKRFQDSQKWFTSDIWKACKHTSPSNVLV